MSKLSKVREALLENPNIVIVAIEEHNYPPDIRKCASICTSMWSQTVNFVVAPKKGIYTAGELQAFMMSLIPSDVELNCKNDYRDWEDKKILDIHIGVLYFDETIGEALIRQEITLAFTDEDLLLTPDFIDGKGIIEWKKEFERRIWVSVYPDSEIAKKYMHKLIPTKELEKRARTGLEGG